MAGYLPPLQIHVAFNKDFLSGPAWSRRLQEWFTGNVGLFAVPEPNIPVFVWSNASGELPPDLAWTEAERSALLLLTDDTLVADDAWRKWVDRQWRAKRKTDLFVPCAATKHFANGGEAFAVSNAIRLDVPSVTEPEEDLVLLSTHSLHRWFARTDGPSKPVRLFISHAKARRGLVSGRDLALKLKGFAQSQPAGDVFFDEVGIGGGEEFVETLADAVSESIVIVLLTDVFSSRFWCGWEVVTAKTKLRPLVVVNALEEGEATSLAYIGKTPTIRWNAVTPAEQSNAWMHRRIIATALLEALRLTHDLRQTQAVQALMFPGSTHVWSAARPPELATLPPPAPDGNPTRLLHADPPLPRYEIELVRRHRPDLTLVSVAQALASASDGSLPLKGSRIAVSISNGPDRDARGFTGNAQERLWTRLATHLLAAGAELAYGGDPRVGGYTDQLIDLALSTADAGQPFPPEVIHWYVGWPIATRLTASDKARLPTAVVLHPGTTPSDVTGADPSWPVDDLVPEHRFAWTLGMRDMRLAMASDCHARILVGGQFRAVSPWPGLLEEFETFIGKPIYLIGALGGTTRLIIDALLGKTPTQFSISYQDDGGTRTALREFYEAQKGAVDWGQRLQRIHTLGLAGLNNGLSTAENERLFITRDATEMISLVLRGLRNRLGSPGGLTATPGAPAVGAPAGTSP